MLYNKASLKCLCLGLSAAALTACATTRPAASSNTPSFGKATVKNLSAQRIAPSPEQKANTYIPANRARRELARDAYETNTLQPLPNLGTTDVN